MIGCELNWWQSGRSLSRMRESGGVLGAPEDGKDGPKAAQPARKWGTALREPIKTLQYTVIKLEVELRDGRLAALTDRMWARQHVHDVTSN
ncbi:hypothetical protein M758_1G262400 [Ceratodon purpureus]|uniref:Uncharacterized protein n=1 Tax=Ceratodon purpureus TaxID=3225 RepID=A0A8T0J9Q9_CERPU|nr:hypothetical protein KC19_1G270000 [Ceratodon purpureus]KAG0631560.1 hypothetical protein M758_1G262400 [Ceratodon purpureus]